jgi:integrase
LLPLSATWTCAIFIQADVRRWRKERLAAGSKQERPFGPVTVAKAYRLLHAILSTAMDDRLIRRNPCRIKGAGQEGSPERAVIPLATLIELLDRVPPRYRALVLLATFASLRFGELAGLRRGQVDLDGCAVHVIVSTAETDDGRLIDDDPKSQAGRRRVAFPKEIAPELRWHLERFAQPGGEGLVFIGPQGGRLRRSTFRWTRPTARNAMGLPDLHFHDLRHTGNTMAAGQGASLRELMERMGHSSTRPETRLLKDQLETDDHALDLERNSQSGRRESNPHDQLGRCTAHGRHGR